MYVHSTEYVSNTRSSGPVPVPGSERTGRPGPALKSSRVATLAFKQAIRALSTAKGAAKCPSKFLEGEPSTDMFVSQLLATITSDSGKFQLRKWWSGEVVSMLLHLHLNYMRDFSNGAQNASWLEGKAVEHRGEIRHGPEKSRE